MKKNKRIQNHKVIRRKKAQENFVAILSGINLIFKEYFKSQKVTNAQKLISQTEPPAPKEIKLDKKFEVMFRFCLEQQELVRPQKKVFQGKK